MSKKLTSSAKTLWIPMNIHKSKACSTYMHFVKISKTFICFVFWIKFGNLLNISFFLRGKQDVNISKMLIFWMENFHQFELTYYFFAIIPQRCLNFFFLQIIFPKRILCPKNSLKLHLRIQLFSYLLVVFHMVISF